MSNKRKLTKNDFSRILKIHEKYQEGSICHDYYYTLSEDRTAFKMEEKYKRNLSILNQHTEFNINILLNGLSSVLSFCHMGKVSAVESGTQWRPIK